MTWQQALFAFIIGTVIWLARPGGLVESSTQPTATPVEAAPSAAKPGAVRNSGGAAGGGGGSSGEHVGVSQDCAPIWWRELDRAFDYDRHCLYR